MIAVDTNILIYAHRAESRWFDRANAAIRSLVDDGRSWAIPWPCVGEFFSAVTGTRVVDDPTPPEAAVAQLDAWMESPTLVLLGESSGMWPLLRNLLLDSKVTGPRTHDSRIAAICITHRVRELWTADRDYGRFPGLRTRNPLVA